jgi:hypothetical protein
MLKKILNLEKRFEKFCRTTQSEIDQLKREVTGEQEVPTVRHSGCSLQSPEGLQGIW